MVWSATSLLALLGCGGDAEKVEGLVGILVTPDPVIVPVGGRTQLYATGLLEDRESIDMTHLVKWKSPDEAIASVGNSLDAEGLLTGHTPGSASAYAVYEGIQSPSIVITVTDAELLRLTVSPDAIVAATGDHIQLAAEAGFSDGSSGDVTGQVRWITDDGAVAQLSGEGLLTAAGAGSTEIVAEWDGVTSEPVPVTVSGSSGGKPDLTISALTASAAGGIVDLTVQVTNSGGSSASEFWVDVWGDPSSTPAIGDIGDDYVLLSYLGPGQSTSLSFDLYADSTVHVLVDTNDDIDESSESNNASSAAVSSGGGGGGGGGSDGPDLVIPYFDYIADEESIYYYIEIDNQGDEAADSFYVDVFVDAYSEPAINTDGDDYTLISGLSAGETAYAEFLIDTWCHWCWSWAVADSLDWVDEDNENNNVSGPLDVYSK
jgi:hypothetical protein